MLCLVNFTIVAELADIDRVGEHITQDRQPDGVATVCNPFFGNPGFRVDITRLQQPLTQQTHPEIFLHNFNGFITQRRRKQFIQKSRTIGCFIKADRYLIARVMFR